VTDLQLPPTFPLAAADRCVLCGLCLPHCPTYRLTQDENESPRGRINLMRALATHALPLDGSVAGHLSRCLDCRACERVCPSGVTYGQLIAAGRVLCLPQTRPGFIARFLLWLVQRRTALNAVTKVVHGLTRTGLLRLFAIVLQRSRLGGILASIPRIQRAEQLPASSAPTQRRVVLFRGCLTPMLDADTLRSAETVLRHFGVEMIVPENQTCCGGMHRDAGDTATADRLHAINRRALAIEGVEAIVAIASGCGARLAQELGLPVLDIHDYLAGLPLPDMLELAPLSQRVAVQDPCSLRNTLRAEQSVYALLRRIPGLTVEPLAENQFCCGGAGLYQLREPAMAEKLRAPKLDALQQSAPDMLVSANLGCALHVTTGLRERNLAIPVMHPLVLFARQLRTRQNLR
jgi:glycolate oxidase iron-sulfur subunit